MSMHPKLSPTSNHWDQKNLDSETIHPAHSQAHIQTWAPNPCINQSPKPIKQNKPNQSESPPENLEREKNLNPTSVQPEEDQARPI